MEFNNLNKKFSRVKDFPWQTMDGEAIIIEPRTQVSHEINEVGTLIWELMDGQCTLGDISKRVQKIFEIEGDTADRDTLEFAETLSERGLASCQN